MKKNSFSLHSSHGLWQQIFKNKVAYAYILPFYALFLIFSLFPLLMGLYVSFFRWDGLSPMKFVFLRNYAGLFTDPIFWKAVKNTFFIGIIAHIPILFGGLILAYILNSYSIKLSTVFKTIYFLPMVTSVVAISLVFQSMFGYNAGLINYFLTKIGFEKIEWFGGLGNYIKPVIISVFSWKWIGWNMVIYLAGMQGISEDIYEAAKIDGASHKRIFFNITIPLLKPIIVFTLIQSTIGMMNLFTEPLMLVGLKGGTGNQGLTLMMYLLDKAPYGNNLYGYASACAYVICLCIIVISSIITAINKEKD